MLISHGAEEMSSGVPCGFERNILCYCMVIIPSPLKEKAGNLGSRAYFLYYL